MYDANVCKDNQGLIPVIVSCKNIHPMKYSAYLCNKILLIEIQMSIPNNIWTVNQSVGRRVLVITGSTRLSDINQCVTRYVRRYKVYIIGKQARPRQMVINVLPQLLFLLYGTYITAGILHGTDGDLESIRWKRFKEIYSLLCSNH